MPASVWLHTHALALSHIQMACMPLLPLISLRAVSNTLSIFSGKLLWRFGREWQDFPVSKEIVPFPPLVIEECWRSIPVYVCCFLCFLSTSLIWKTEMSDYWRSQELFVTNTGLCHYTSRLLVCCQLFLWTYVIHWPATRRPVGDGLSSRLLHWPFHFIILCRLQRKPYCSGLWRGALSAVCAPAHSALTDK